MRQHRKSRFNPAAVVATALFLSAANSTADEKKFTVVFNETDPRLEALYIGFASTHRLHNGKIINGIGSDGNPIPLDANGGSTIGWATVCLYSSSLQDSTDKYLRTEHHKASVVSSYLPKSFELRQLINDCIIVGVRDTRAEDWSPIPKGTKTYTGVPITGEFRSRHPMLLLGIGSHRTSDGRRIPIFRILPKPSRRDFSIYLRNIPALQDKNINDAEIKISGKIN